MKNINVKEIMTHFNIDDEITDYNENNTGIINNTFIVEGAKRKYLLQKINTEVFKDPDALMNNINDVTKYYRDHSNKKETLNVIKTNDGALYYRDNVGNCYRVYNYIENSITYDAAKDAKQFAKVGKAFGNFCKILDDYPSSRLVETIPNFHNTVVRYNKFLEDIKKDVVGRVNSVQEEIDFVKKHADEVGVVVNLINEGKIPVRVTHNDTKINNVLLDKNTGEDICVVDLDTVMPGSVLYDFGDAIRSGASLIVEDSDGYDKVGINMEYFNEFSKAFLMETADILTNEEINYLAFSCRLLTLELIIRFLDDYISGDTYFRCNYPEHNLVRSRNQIRLLMSMEEHYDEMKKIIMENSRYCKDYCLRKVIQ